MSLDLSREIEKELKLAAAKGVADAWEIADLACQNLKHKYGKSTFAYPMKGGKQIYYKGETYNIKRVGGVYKVTIES